MRANAKTTLLGRSALLVPYSAGHVEAYHSWMEDEALREATASERLTLEEEREMQRSWAEDDASERSFFLFRFLSFFFRSRSLPRPPPTHTHTPVEGDRGPLTAKKRHTLKTTPTKTTKKQSWLSSSATRRRPGGPPSVTSTFFSGSAPPLLLLLPLPPPPPPSTRPQRSK